MQAPVRPNLSPSDALLALHELHRSYESFAEFQPELTDLLQKGQLLDQCVSLTRSLGIIEPLTGKHIRPEGMQIQGPNWRESLVCNGLLSRTRAVLSILERLYGSLETMRTKDVYTVEALTGFALWLRRHLGTERVLCSEYLEEVDNNMNGIDHQDLCELTLSSGSLDLVICNEVFEHVRNLEQALSEIVRVLRPGGRLIATCPLAFGQNDNIIKAILDPVTGETRILGEPELHGDPLRPEHGSLVYRIPGWEILDQLRREGIRRARMHHIASWKHGIIGCDLPGVLVIEGQK